MTSARPRPSLLVVLALAISCALFACRSDSTDSAPADGRATPSAAPALMQLGYLGGGGSMSLAPHDANTESYAAIDENGFQSAARRPLSTFSIDVDTASYANVRRFLREGRLPPKDAVRIEELVNAFDYDDAGPADGQPFGVTTEVGVAPWSPGHLLVRIGLAAQRVDVSELPPSNFVFLLDVSGSMNSPDKLPLLKRSLALLVDSLDRDDRVAIVVYAGAAGLVLPSTACDEEHKPQVLDALERLSAGGSTAGGAGLRLAYDQVREHFVEGGINRVILATDGDFNVGPSSDAEMVRLIEDERGHGAFLTVLGFGTGNLKDSKMEQLADRGNGQYCYVDSFLEARRVLVEQLGGTLLTVAKDVKIQVEFNPARVAAYRLVGYENRLLADEDFADDSKDAGELGAGHHVTALYEVVPVGADDAVDVGTVDPLRYGEVTRTENEAHGDELLFVKLRWKAPDGDTSELLTRPVAAGLDGGTSDDFRFAAAVAGFGMLLRDSEHTGTLTYDDVLELARGARGDDPRGRRAELLGLVETAASL
ncbi:MAG: von Willebrand factor type A domain-containing protein [Planctomycetes bacterium]|nr:von Willebrand factor type A domain-containing protein [Planctomycetota bacterium]